jgi:fermentation-respiration switch protein FrsA (DUF1100 family)
MSAEAFLTALKTRDFAAAAANFDAAVKAALPADKLADVWDSQVAGLGPLASWTIVHRAQRDGKDVNLVLLIFERGELHTLISITPQTQELCGLFFIPIGRPAASASAFPVEEVSIGGLKGTLTLPNESGPFPGVVLVHGSGPNDRDATIAANKPFRDLAEGLASRGVAVLRYDKRTFPVSIDEEVVLDAIVAVHLLKARPEIDPDRVFVLGHSLGALLAPEIAVRSAPVAGAILLAPPGRAPWDSVLAQMRYLEVPADKLAEVEKAVELLAAGQPLLGAPAAYWQDWAARDGVAMARKLQRPILILRGDRDYQVTDEDLATWRNGLAGIANVELMTIPGLNHLFIHGTGKPGPAEYATPGHVDEGVIVKIASFVRAHSRLQ